MDYQVLFNIAGCIAGLGGGWILNRIYSAIDRLDNDVRNLPKDYVSKDDYRIDIQDMNKKLDKIFDLLQNKVDK